MTKTAAANGCETTADTTAADSGTRPVRPGQGREACLRAAAAAAAAAIGDPPTTTAAARCAAARPLPCRWAARPLPWDTARAVGTARVPGADRAGRRDRG